MRIEQSVAIDATRDEVWDVVTDPRLYPDFLVGVTRWEIAGEAERGLGARYRVLIRVGSSDVGGLIEVVEWDPDRGDMAWSSVTGVDQRGRWLIRSLGKRRTRATFRFAYGVAGGGISGMVAERIAAIPLRRRFKRSLVNLKHLAELRARGSA